jgi:hypothetical protein
MPAALRATLTCPVPSGSGSPASRCWFEPIFTGNAGAPPEKIPVFPVYAGLHPGTGRRLLEFKPRRPRGTGSLGQDFSPSIRRTGFKMSIKAGRANPPSPSNAVSGAEAYKPLPPGNVATARERVL